MGPPNGRGGGGSGGGQLPANCTFDGQAQTTTCVTTTTGQTTDEVVSTATDVVVTETTEDVVSEATEFVERPTTGACEVGNSGRVGTAEGFNTDEVLVTTTETFDVATKTITTEVFSGRGMTGTLLSSTPVTEETGRTLQDTDVQRELQDTDVDREVVNTEFTQAGKCKNVPGQQPQTGQRPQTGS